MTPNVRFELPKTRRLLRPDEFDEVFRRRLSRSDRSIVVYACRNGLDCPRLGLVVSRKCGNAVRRNRWKRRLREAFRQVQHELPPGVDLVVIPKSTATPMVDQLKRSLVNLADSLAQKLASKSTN